MLPPYIIEQIRKREDEERRKSDARRPVLQLPMPEKRPERAPEAAEEVSRGIVVIDLLR